MQKSNPVLIVLPLAVFFIMPAKDFCFFHIKIALGFVENWYLLAGPFINTLMFLFISIPMAEFVMKDLVCRAGYERDFLIESAATSREEIGNNMHYGTHRKLQEMGIPFTRRAARQITPADYNKYDYLVAMDDENLYYMNRCWNSDPQHKIKMLLSFAGKTRDIADP